MSACLHEWLDRPESDTFECLLCGVEGSGFPPGGGPWQPPQSEPFICPRCGTASRLNDWIGDPPERECRQCLHHVTLPGEQP